MTDQIKHYLDKLKYEIDSWDLSESLKKDDSIIVIDTRAQQAYEKEHIPNAINLPHKTITAQSTKLFDRNKLYITYCDGIGCNASTKGALNMVELGFNVKELLGGLDWWIRDGHETQGTNARNAQDIECGC